MTENIKAVWARGESWMKLATAVAAALFAAGQYVGKITERIGTMEVKVSRIETRLESMPTKTDLATLFLRSERSSSRRSLEGGR